MTSHELSRAIAEGVATGNQELRAKIDELTVALRGRPDEPGKGLTVRVDRLG